MHGCCFSLFCYCAWIKQGNVFDLKRTGRVQVMSSVVLQSKQFQIWTFIFHPSMCSFIISINGLTPVSICLLPLQSRSPKHGPNPQPGVGDQVDHLSLASLESLDTMSETDAPTAFTRGSRVRASLPVVRSTNQTKDRSLGILSYLLLWYHIYTWFFFTFCHITAAAIRHILPWHTVCHLVSKYMYYLKYYVVRCWKPWKHHFHKSWWQPHKEGLLEAWLKKMGDGAKGV